MKALCFGVLFAVFGIELVAAQTVPSGMTYQGRLTDASNVPVPDGTGYEIEVRLWSAPAGGTLLWGTRYSGVPLNGGAFNLILGSGGSPIAGAMYTDLGAAFNTSSVHLGITTTKNAAGAAIPSPTEILPRQQVFSSPFAFRAGLADGVQPGAVTSAMVKDGDVRTVDIAPAAVETGTIADQAVNTSKIANGTILGEDVAIEGVTPDRLSHDIAGIVDEKPSGASGGTAVAGWNKRELNKVAYSRGSSISVSGNAIVLAAGTYLVRGEVPSYQTSENRAVLRRAGETTALLYGATSRNTGGAIPTASFSGIVTVAAPSESFEVWHYVSQGVGGNGLGVPSSIPGLPEVYTTVQITRLK